MVALPDTNNPVEDPAVVPVEVDPVEVDPVEVPAADAGKQHALRASKK